MSTPSMVCCEDGRLGQEVRRVSDEEDTLQDDRSGGAGYKKDTCQDDMSTVKEEPTCPGDTMVTRPPVQNQLITTPSIGNNVLQPVGGCQEDGMVSRAGGMDDAMTKTSEDTYHADMRTDNED